MPISSLGAAHVAAALAALVFGMLVLAMQKGTQLHRAMGMAYATAMLALSISALMIYRISGHFGPFHALALLSLATIVVGVTVAVRRRPGWLSRHYQMMNFSYLGLLSAATTQMLVNLPALHGPVRGTATGVASAVAFTAVGFIILPRLRRRVLTAIVTD
jgi:uncharacterized membrane protein